MLALGILYQLTTTVSASEFSSICVHKDPLRAACPGTCRCPTCRCIQLKDFMLHQMEVRPALLKGSLASQEDTSDLVLEQMCQAQTSCECCARH